MLVERGAKRVVALDIVPPPADALKDPRIEVTSLLARSLVERG